jgi:hypothetical protein
MIIEQLHDDLVAAGSARARPRHRLPAVAPLALVAAIFVTALVLVRGAEPEREAGPSARGPRVSSVNVAGERFRVTLGDEGRLCEGFAGHKALGCLSSFVLADNFRVHGTEVGYGVSRQGGEYVVAGVAGTTVDAVEVHSPAGVRRARFGATVLKVPVRIPPPSSLTPEGRRVAAGFPGELRVRAYAVSLPLDHQPRELTLIADAGGRRAHLRIPGNVIPPVTSRQRRRLSLLEREATAADASAAAELRRAGKSAGVAASARVATEFRGRPVFAYRNRIGEICLVAHNTACTKAASAVTDQPLVSGLENSRADEVTMVGLLHDGPRFVRLEHRDGTSTTVPVTNNVFAFVDRGVVRLHWEGLRGPASLDLDP